MDCISKTILFLWICDCIIVTNSQIAEDGIIDCTVDCACCKDQRCGPGKFPEGNCYDGCIDGYRGSRCYQKCIYNCSKCNENVNTCTECFDGYFPGPSSDCTAKCPIGCKTCTSNTACIKCKDEYFNANGFTDCRYRHCSQNCKCQQNQCVSCKTGFYDTSTLCGGICPSNCVSCSSGDNCDLCRDGYFNGHLFDDYNLPRLTNCTHECHYDCKRCSSYNTCLQCKTGRYGSTCQDECSMGCEIRDCQIDSGNCKCSSNFSGDTCDQCQTGKHGTLCTKQCSLGCKANVCDKESGTCLNGCIVDTVIGQTCNECSMDSQEQTVQFVTAIILGSLLAVSIVVNIVFVGRFLLEKIRTSRRKPMIPETGEAFYENSGTTENVTEMVGNTKTNGNDGTTFEHALQRVCISKKNEYEDIRNVDQGSEHEYEHIPPTDKN